MDKREMAGDYEILQAVRLGGKEVLLGYNPKDGCAPYMTSYRVVNFFGDYIYPEAIAGNDYLEIMQAFLNRVQEQAKVVEQFRENRKVPIETLGREHCRERGEKESLEGKLIILRPAIRRPPSTPWALPPAILRRWACVRSAARSCRRRKSSFLQRTAKTAMMQIQKDKLTPKGAKIMEVTYRMQDGFLLPNLLVPQERPVHGKADFPADVFHADPFTRGDDFHGASRCGKLLGICFHTVSLLIFLLAVFIA